MKLSILIILQIIINACTLITLSSAEELPSIEKQMYKQFRNPAVAAQYISQHKEAIDNMGDQELKKLPPISVFKFLSGNTDPVNNLPMMFAHGSKQERKVTVVGCGVQKEFPLQEMDEAMKIYKELLTLNGYIN